MNLKYLILLICFQALSQEKPNFTALDSLYREDQFYIGITYNALQDRPNGVAQKKFTPSFSFGFLRDMPINKARTFAVAAGLGYSINNYNENLLVTENNGTFNYNVINANEIYDRNKLILHYIDLPIEFRWRNSTPESHKFYRVYGGIKASYLVYDYSKFVGNQEILVSNNNNLNKIQIGTYLDFGYNSLNFYIYYGFNPIFKSAEIDGKNIDMKTVNFGLMFYIL
jgi:hypothetical protein